ncbi:outer membrane beta-barrel protein [Roseimicrobium sp. ORNL1]|nr:outer membrane beta-barrel protein [Roseimicrobium sp. ORNL1]
MRSRAALFRQQEAAQDQSATSSAGVYDFNRGEYSGESTPEERPLGERTQLEENVGRSLGQDDIRGGAYIGASRRRAADYTSSSGPYPASTTFFAPTYITDPFLAGKRNIKLGPVNIGLGLNGNVEYNDNINQSGSAPVDDFIAGLYMNVDANYQITEQQRLSLSVTLGVDHYFNHPEYSPNGKDFNLNVFPGSTLAFDVMVGDILFVIYDRVSVRPASQTEFALDDLDVFGVFQNDIGVAMSWALNSKTSLSVNFNHSDSIALEDNFSETDRMVDSISASLAYTPTGTYTVGIEGSVSWINYDEEFNNDGITSSAGVFLILPITRSTILKASGGYQHFEFDSPPTFTRSVTDQDIASTQSQIDSLSNQAASINVATSPDPVAAQQQLVAIQEQQAALQDQLAAQQIQKQQDDVTAASRSFDTNSELDDYYYNVTLFNQLNARISHQLSFGHESSLNTSSNFLTADYVTYAVGLIAWRGSRLTVSTYYEDAEDSGGRLAEDVEQWGVDALLTHRLNSRLVLGLGYHYGNTDSNIELRDYNQHAFSLDVSWAFNRKMNVGVGYRYLTTDAEDSRQSFDQNRFVMSMNYNF